jgi:two-component system sensor histidine kinase DesK
MPLQPQLLRLRRWLVPDSLELGWMPLGLLGYLVFLFVPFVFGLPSGGGEPWFAIPAGRITLTLGSIVVFLPLYVLGYRVSGTKQVLAMLGIASIGYALLPFNPFANTYLIYAAGFSANLCRPLWQRSAWLLAISAVFVVEVLWLGYPLFIVAITLLIATSVFVANHFQAENARKRSELKLSHEEVRRLAAMAERERIGRDLHDLLGHTLSLVALKSELAGKLIERDPLAARREIDDVARVSRDALSQVRRAVSGIRAAGLAAELASARLLLEYGGVSFRYDLGEARMAPELETVLALAVREAVTNIQRHARARQASVVLQARGGQIRLRIEDDGRGGVVAHGNGLSGMRERIESCGGQLKVQSIAGSGTLIEIMLPQSVLHEQVPDVSGLVAPRTT